VIEKPILLLLLGILRYRRSSLQWLLFAQEFADMSVDRTSIGCHGAPRVMSLTSGHQGLPRSYQLYASGARLVITVTGPDG